jgi:hypothetical protein
MSITRLAKPISESTRRDCAPNPANVPPAIGALDATLAERGCKRGPGGRTNKRARTNFDAAYASTFCLHASLSLPLAPVPHGDEIVNNIIHYFVEKHVDSTVPVAIQG